MDVWDRKADVGSANGVEPWIDTRECARRLRTSEDDLLRKARRGAIPAHRLGGRWRLVWAEIEAETRFVPPSRQAHH